MKKLIWLFLLISTPIFAWENLGSWSCGPCTHTAINADYAFMSSGGFLGIVDLDTYTLLSNTQICGNILHMQAQEHYLFVSSSVDGLLIVDVSDPAAPVTVATLEGMAMSSLIDGNRLYVAKYTSGLDVYDITDPASPIFLGNGTEWGYTRDIAVYGQYGYVAQSSMGLKIINIADPAAMTLVGELDFQNNTAVVLAVHDGYLYVGSLGEDGFEVFDLTDPAAPTSVAYVDVSSSYKFQFMNNYLFLAAVGSGFKVYDISSPANISELYAFDETIAYDIAINTSHISVATQEDGLEIYPLAEDKSPQKINTFEMPFSAMTFYAHDGFLYFPVHGQGLRILDMNDPLNIMDYDYYDLNPDAVIFQDDLAYMAHDDEIHIVDNSDRTNPLKITDLEVNGRQFGLVLNYPYLYVYSHNAVGDDYFLHIIDVTHPGTPELVTSVNAHTYFYRAEYYQNMLYLLDKNKMLYQVDVSNPEAVSIPAIPVFTDSINGFWMRDQYAYLTTTQDELYIYDFADAENLTLVNTMATNEYYTKPEFLGDIGYSPGFMGKNIIDFTNPIHPVMNGFISIGGYTGGTAISNGRLYVQKIIMEDKIKIYDLSQPFNPGQLGQIASFGRNQSVVVRDGLAYAATGSGGMRIFDFDKTTDFQLSQWQTTGNVQAVAFSGDYACLAVSNAGLQLIDISEPAYPFMAGAYKPATNSTVYDITISGDYAYLLGGPYNDVYDISDPMAPDYVGAIPASAQCRAGCIDQSYLYTADAGSGLQIYDISDPASVTLAGGVDTPGWAYDVTVQNGYAYVADGSNHLRIYDVSDPAHPAEAASLEIAYATVRGVVIYKNYAVLACDYRGIYFVDITDPLHPQEMGSIYLYDHEFNSVAVENGYIYATAEMNGVYRFGHELITLITENNHAIPLEYSLSENYPNPFNPVTTIRYTLPRSEHVVLDIYNATGQHVKTLYNGQQITGTHLLQWDGTSDFGTPVASGVYFYRIKAGHFTKSCKMVLVH